MNELNVLEQTKSQLRHNRITMNEAVAAMVEGCGYDASVAGLRSEREWNSAWNNYEREMLKCVKDMEAVRRYLTEAVQGGGMSPSHAGTLYCDVIGIPRERMKEFGGIGDRPQVSR